MIPAAFDYVRPALARRGARARSAGGDRQGARRRPEPAAAAEAAAGRGRHARRHRPAARAARHPDHCRRRLRDRRARRPTRSPRLGDRSWRLRCARVHRRHRRRPGPQPGHGRRRDRARRPRLRHARPLVLALDCDDRRCARSARRAGRAASTLLPGAVRDGPRGRRDPDRDPLAADRCRPAPARPTGSWSSPPRATRSSASRLSSLDRRRASSTRPRRAHRGRRVAYRAKAVEAALIGTDGSPSRRSPRRPSTPPTARPSTRHPCGREYRRAMAVVYMRRAIEAALAAPPDRSPASPACGSSGSAPGRRAPARLAGRSSPATCRRRAALVKGRRLTRRTTSPALAAAERGSSRSRVLVPEAGELHEDDAALRLAAAVAGPG